MQFEYRAVTNLFSNLERYAFTLHKSYTGNYNNNEMHLLDEII